MPQQHENVTTEDIANPTRAAVDEPRAQTNPIDSDRTDADRVESDRVESDRVESDRVESDRVESDRVAPDHAASDRAETGQADADRTDFGRTESDRISGDRLSDDEDRVTTIDETARPADTTLAGQREPGHDSTITGRPAPEHDTEATGQRESGHAAADVLFDEADAARFRGRWREVQAGFVDDPKRAVQDADVLVAELMQSLASAFSERKHLLENQWREGSSAETEDLRLALRGYRSFLDQLLAH